MSEHFVSQLQLVSELILALSVIIGGVLAVVRATIVKPLREHVDRKVGELDEKFDARLRPIEYQLKTNGGGSMRDAVSRTERKVDGLTTFLRATASTLEHEGIPVPDPADFDLGGSK